MRGSLENPPITISVSRWLPGLILPVVLFFSVMGTWLIVSVGINFGAAFFTSVYWLMTAFLIWRLVWSPWIEISPRGLAWFNGRNILNFEWRDFATFRAYLPNRGLFKYVGFDFVPDSPKRHEMRAQILVAAAGLDGSLGGPWGGIRGRGGEFIEPGEEKMGTMIFSRRKLSAIDVAEILAGGLLVHVDKAKESEEFKQSGGEVYLSKNAGA